MDNILGAGTIAYSGNVSISLVCGRKTIKTYNYHNSGAKPLFRALCMFLAGQTSKPPTRLVLYNVSDNYEIADIIRNEAIKLDNYRCSKAYTVTPTFVEDIDGSIYCRYEVQVPIDELFIAAASSDQVKRVNALALFDKDSDRDEDIMAYFQLSTPIYIGGGANYAASLLVRWDLSFINSQTEVDK